MCANWQVMWTFYCAGEPISCIYWKRAAHETTRRWWSRSINQNASLASQNSRQNRKDTNCRRLMGLEAPNCLTGITTSMTGAI